MATSLHDALEEWMRKLAVAALGTLTFVGAFVACGSSDEVTPGEGDPSAIPSGGDSGSGGDGGATVADGAVPGDGSPGPGAIDAGDGGDGGLGPQTTTTFVSAISANEDLVCVITKAGALRCWGSNRPPTTLGAGSTWKDVSVGGLHADGVITMCGVRSDDSLWCWPVDHLSPEVQPSLATFSKVSVSSANRCAIATTGALFCWGSNNVFGPLGTGDTSPRTQPTQIGADLDWKLVAPGKDHTCAIKNGGALYCWGWNAFGQVGDDTVDLRNAPVPVAAAQTFVDVSTRNVATCAVRSDGALMCWGSSAITAAKVPTDVGGTKDWKKVRLSLTHGCGTRANGTLWCWGQNDRGQLGLPFVALNNARTVPAQVGSETDWADVAVGEGFTCGVKTDGSVRCFGSNGRGQLAQSPSGHLAPKRIGAAGEWAWVSAGVSNTCGVRKDGTLACWGVGGGLPTAGTPSETPTTIGIATDWKTVKAGTIGACATKTNDALHCWSTATAPSSVGLVASAYDVGGYGHQCAIAAGSLYCWGDGIFGKLGNGSNLNVAAPTKVGVDTWTSVDLSAHGSCGTKSDGTLWCFGFGRQGTVKLGTATTWTKLDGTGSGETFFGLQGQNMWRWDFAAPPVASGAESDWTQIATGYGHVCGIRAGGTLWCKGVNDQGQLGDGTLLSRTNAVQVGVATDWTRVTASGAMTCGLRGAGDLYCWGANDVGELGDGKVLYPPTALVP